MYVIAVILLKVRMNTITITPVQKIKRNYFTDLNIKWIVNKMVNMFAGRQTDVT